MALKHFDFITYLEALAPTQLKESYDNVGCLVGNNEDTCTGVMIGFDCTASLVEESIAKKCNLIITHHPLIFGGIKKISSHPFPDAVIKLLIKNDITHYAIHTNIDNITEGVNQSFSTAFQLTDVQALVPKQDTLEKFIYFAPQSISATTSQELIKIGARQIEEYKIANVQPIDKEHYSTNPDANSAKFINQKLTTRVEMLIPQWTRKHILRTLSTIHLGEKITYDIIPLANTNPQWGSGIIGKLPQPLDRIDFFQKLQTKYKTPAIRYTKNKQNTPLQQIAFCGGSGASFIKSALLSGADAYVTGDLKYHDFLDCAQTNLLLVDIGHYESEYSVISLLYQLISSKFPNFAVFKEAQQASPIGNY